MILVFHIITYLYCYSKHCAMMSHLCNRCVREFLILARTWFAFGLPSKTECDNTTLVVFHYSVHEQLILKVLAFVELLHTCGKMFIFIFKFLDLISKPFIVHCQLIVKVI